MVSEAVREYIKDVLDANADSDVSDGEHREARELISAITSVLVRSRHTPTTETIVGELDQLTRSFGASFLEDRFDENYTRDLLEQIPAFAERTSKLLVKTLPVRSS